MHITWNTPQLREAKVILRGGGKRVPHIGPRDMHTANSRLFIAEREKRLS